MNPIRTCIGCRRTAAKADLLRLVVDQASGAVVIDRRGRLPGRGAYLHPGPDCLATALRRRTITRALRNSGADLSVLSGADLSVLSSADLSVLSSGALA